MKLFRWKHLNDTQNNNDNILDKVSKVTNIKKKKEKRKMRRKTKQMVCKAYYSIIIKFYNLKLKKGLEFCLFCYIQ